MPLHPADTNRFNNGNQVVCCRALDQFGRVVAFMRKPGKQGPCRLLRRRAVGFFKEYFVDALGREHCERCVWRTPKHVVRPIAGQIALENSAFAVDSRPDLGMVIYSPATSVDRVLVKSLL
jgi:hypothetical protein